VSEAQSGPAALQQMQTEQFDLLLTDLRMEPLDGITVLRRSQDLAPNMPVLLMTAYGSIESAVEAMRLGAVDYITKPFQPEELLIRVGRALDHRRLQREVGVWAGEFHERFGLEHVVGRSTVMRELMARVARVARTDVTVLITGESGTG